MKGTLKFIVLIAVIILAVSAARPFWTKYWIGKEMEAAAVYGTKHSLEDTRKFISEKMKTEGYRFRGEHFQIEKDEKNRVTITLHYTDAVSVFGVKLKDVGFTLERRASEVKGML